VWAWKDGESIQLPESAAINAGGLALDDDGSLLVTDKNTASVIRLVPTLSADWLDPAATPASSPQATPAD
jgi:hypothetical protein